MRPLIESLPGYYQNSTPVVELERAIGTQMEALWEDREDLLRQLWVDTATWGLAWWESWCGLPVDTTLSHEARRARVKAKLRGRGTTTVELIRSSASSYVDAQVSVREEAERYHFTVVFSHIRSQPPELTDLTHTINEVKPAHLEFDYLFLYDFTAAITLRQEVRMSGLIYHYKLGAWALGVHPFGQMEEEVLVTDAQGQIQPALLEGVAEFTAGDIARARVNGTKLIEDFEVKEAGGQSVAVEYFVQMEEVPHITSLELLDASGTVLTRAEVDIILRGPTRLSHIIPVQEGGNANG